MPHGVNDTTPSRPLTRCDHVGGDDGDNMDGDDGMVRDASFQQDPEHFEFNCLSSEETWNYLDSQAREASKEIKARDRELSLHAS